MNILITGNMGYVGPVVTAHLRSVFPDAHLVGVDSGWFAHCLSTSRRLPEVDLDEQWFTDVRDLTSADLEGIDAIVHLAAVSNDPMGNRFEGVTDAINFGASVRLAELAAEAGVKRFVFASSCSIYGVADDPRARCERDPVNPLTAYARSKIATEQALAQMADSRLVVTNLRFATACGMSKRLRLDLVLNDFVASALTTGAVLVLSDGTPWRPLIHVKDMARAIEWALIRDADENGEVLTINAGSDDWNFQVADLAHAVADTLGGVEVSINRDAQPDRRSYRVDFSMFKRLAPQHTPRETLDRAIQGLKTGLDEIGFSNPNFRASHFIRLKTLTEGLSTQALTEDLRWRSRSALATETGA
ncbi:NAD(P)-dependent oxidoreductase [Rhizobiaceae bacterium n13]|uniref:NAD(P)-dependent oxidoreductase n=1 Tax=Ferirhizobium litorale TaxID=2927786 RepID=A0AAE3U0S6_9HYPH|nr:NAD(P)-dependent oxidoreductase [Fererhizobium litorale]MDI7862352.1 NAD(P)-dependent oxidoreductase [Fererhizobium litorale]MDI7922374.1 NAD(P)-dependent oxidoreductase [Fererhizobium litorale]